MSVVQLLHTLRETFHTLLLFYSYVRTHVNNATVENQARTKACVVKRKYYNLLVKGIFLLYWHGLTTVVLCNEWLRQSSCSYIESFRVSNAHTVLIKRTVTRKLALGTRSWWMQHCANFFRKWYEFLPFFTNKSYVRNRIREHLADENALMQFCLKYWTKV